MKKYHIKGSLFSHSCEFDLEAESLGLALKKADEEFQKIYREANNFDSSFPIHWTDRKISAKEIK